MPIFFCAATCSFCSWAAEHLLNLTEGLSARAASADGEAPAVVREHITDYAVYLPSGEGAGAGDGAHGTAGAFALGHKAIGVALNDCGRNRLIRLSGRVLLLPVASPVFAGVYRLVANNRHRIGPILGLDACAVPQP